MWIGSSHSHTGTVDRSFWADSGVTFSTDASFNLAQMADKWLIHQHLLANTIYTHTCREQT